MMGTAVGEQRTRANRSDEIRVVLDLLCASLMKPSLSLTVIFATLATTGCIDSPSRTTAESETGASCPIQRCVGTECNAFTPTSEIVDGSHIAKRDAPTTVQPDVPLITRLVRLADPPPKTGQGNFIAPVIPAWRSSADGRIALVDGTVRPILLENLDKPISKQDATLADAIFGPGVPLSKPFTDTSTGGFLCTPDAAQPAPCDDDKDQDCYKLVVVVRDDPHQQLVSGDLMVRVSDPKQRSAHVAEAKITNVRTAAEPFKSAGEMIPTADGHLVTMRIHDGGEAGGGEQMTYKISGNRTVTQPISLVYAYAKDPCRIDEWLETDGKTLAAIRPWPAAYKDDRLHDATGAPLYGIAARQLRDAENHLLAEDQILPGSYPWIDREGNNLLFSTVDPQPVAKTKPAGQFARYPMEIENSGGDLEYVSTAPRGFSMIGAWTQGKAVTLDDMLNVEDYGFDPSDTHRIVLYDANGTPLAVRTNGGSNNGVNRLKLGPTANGNNDGIESLENTFAMHRAALAVTPRDVVWTVTRGLASAEVAFDDFANPNLVLLAPMTASWKADDDARNGIQEDGFTPHDGSAFDYHSDDVRLQNSATSPLLQLADPGQLVGEGRIEPVALGGVSGRGLWLGTDSRATFHFAGDSTEAGKGFYASVFVDARDPLAGISPVLQFTSSAGKTWSLSIDDGSAAVIDDGISKHSIDISCAAQSWMKQWHHLGILFEGAQATLYVDGNPLAPIALSRSIDLVGGDLTVGGVRGWYDEVRVEIDGDGSPLTTRPAPELLCNAAHGTMVSYSGGPQTCATDYTQDLGVGRGYVPHGATPLRDEILTGDAPLFWDQPRPESTTRTFCLTCHVDAADDPGRAPKLTYEALRFHAGQIAADDPRTQPMQPPSIAPGPAMALGNLPMGWITTPDGSQQPASHELGPLTILQWVLPTSPD
jgi:hypothetical protein